MKVTGTWKLNAPLTNTSRQAKIFAHIPDHGAQTTKAIYRIQTPDGEVEAVIPQSTNQSNKWVDLGAYYFGDQIPEVRLDNFNGGSGADIAWDALAFVPGTYQGMKMASFAMPNPAAPDPLPQEPPTWASGTFFPWNYEMIKDSNVTNAENESCTGWERTSPTPAPTPA